MAIQAVSGRNYENKALAINEKANQGEVLQKNIELNQNKNPEKIMLFQNTVNVQRHVANPVASKAVKETSEAAAVSVAPSSNIFSNNTQHSAHNGFVSSIFSGNKTMASALSQPENNQGSNSSGQGQKGNTFVLANKNILDVRQEKLNDDNILSIMGGIC